MEADFGIHLDGKLTQLLTNQKVDGERLARVETLTEEMKGEILFVKNAQLSCPGRLAEMQRQARRSALIIAGKVLGWAVGIAATIAGAVQAIASIFGGTP